MPDLVSQANDLKSAPDQWLAREMQSPSGATPPYLILAELQRRQLLRSGSSQQKPPQSSVAQDTLQNTLKQLMPPQQQGPPPPAGMTPPSSGQQPMPGSTPPRNVPTPPMRTMADGGDVDDGDDGDDFDYFNNLVSRAQPGDIRSMVDASSDRWGVPRAFAHSIIKTESGYRPNLTSPKGAYGPGQLMPATARKLGVDIRDPEQNIDGSMQLLGQLLRKYGNNFQKAAAAYNAGEPALDKRGGNIPPFKETRDYVKKVSNSMRQFQGVPGTSMQQLLNVAPQGVEQMPRPALAIPPMTTPAAAAGDDSAPTVPMLPGQDSGLMAALPPTVAPPADTSTASASAPGGGLASAAAPQSMQDMVKSLKEAYKQIHTPTDFSKQDEAIARMQEMADQALHPSLSNMLMHLGFGLMSSNKGFGEALGEAGMGMTSAMEKQRQEGRQLYLDALKGSIDLQRAKNTDQKEMESFISTQMAASQRWQQQTDLEARRAKDRMDLETKKAELNNPVRQSTLDRNKAQTEAAEGKVAAQKLAAAQSDARRIYVDPAGNVDPTAWGKWTKDHSDLIPPDLANGQVPTKERLEKLVNGFNTEAQVIQNNRLDLQTQTAADRKTAQENTAALKQDKLITDSRDKQNKVLDTTTTKEINNQVGRVNNAIANLGRNDAEGDRTAILEYIPATAGGAGSGLRVTQKEIDTIMGGRGAWDKLEYLIHNWSTGKMFTPLQRQQLTQILQKSQQKLQSQQETIGRARQRLLDSSDVKDHQSIMNDWHKEYDGIAGHALALRDEKGNLNYFDNVEALPHATGQMADMPTLKKFVDSAGGDLEKGKQLAVHWGWKVPAVTSLPGGKAAAPAAAAPAATAPKTYQKTAIGPNNHRIGTNDRGKTWYDVETGQKVQ